MGGENENTGPPPILMGGRGGRRVGNRDERGVSRPMKKRVKGTTGGKSDIGKGKTVKRKTKGSCLHFFSYTNVRVKANWEREERASVQEGGKGREGYRKSKTAKISGGEEKDWGS